MTKTIALTIAFGLLVLSTLTGETTKYADTDIEGAVKRRLSRDPAIFNYDITVGTRDGIVTLTGTVRNLLEKERAGKIALSRKGVRSVVNTLSVAAGNISDKDIQANVAEAIAEVPALTGQTINVAVRGSEVRLTGEVDFYGLIALAGKTASNVYGVKSLYNELRMGDADTDRSDEEVRSHIQLRFRFDVWLNHLFINVDVKDGTVTLSGQVGGEMQRQRAVSRAWVPGVRQVVSEALELDDYVADGTRRDPKAAKELTDRQIQSALEDGLALHQWVTGKDVKVAVKNGVATLSGKVAYLPAKVAAGRLAHNTVGVNQVSNQILVEPNVQVGDSDLAEAIINAWAKGAYTRGLKVKASVSGGTATLTGMVPSLFESQEAAEAAASVRGVSEIVNTIKVDSMRRGYHPGELDEIMEPFPTHVEVLDHLKSDAEIKAAIEDELNWSWFVEDSRVSVSVDAGVAKLQGTVSSRRAMRAALRATADGGAGSIVNELKIRQAID